MRDDAIRNSPWTWDEVVLGMCGWPKILTLIIHADGWLALDGGWAAVQLV